MHDKILLRLASITLLLGLVSLTILSMKAPLLAPPDLIKQNEEFSFEGVVINNYRIGERGKLLVKYESVIPVITEKQLLLNPGDVINISGKISEYKGERQVTANRIFKNS